MDEKNSAEQYGNVVKNLIFKTFLDWNKRNHQQTFIYSVILEISVNVNRFSVN